MSGQSMNRTADAKTDLVIYHSDCPKISVVLIVSISDHLLPQIWEPEQTSRSKVCLISCASGEERFSANLATCKAVSALRRRCWEYKKDPSRHGPTMLMRCSAPLYWSRLTLGGMIPYSTVASGACSSQSSRNVFLSGRLQDTRPVIKFRAC
jgi:hypothetical protein